MTTFARTTVIVSCFASLSIASLAGCASFLGEPADSSNASTFGGTVQKASSPSNFNELQNWLDRNNLVITAGQGSNDYNRSFAQGFVIAYGEGSPSREAHNTGQKRLTAERAAEVVAQRNLADFFAANSRNGEIRFTSYTTKIKAFIKGAENVFSEYDPVTEKAVVLLKLNLKGARNFAP